MRIVAAFLLALSLASPASADVFRLIDEDQEAAQVRVDMIQQAQQEIMIELFRISEDEMALTYLALLRDAAHRGVNIKLLIDATFNKLSDAMQAHMLQAGIEIKVYHPLRLTKVCWVTRRLHDKMILVDRDQMLVGGRNLQNPWYGLPGTGFTKRAYIDRDVYVRGSVVEVAYDYFMRLWNSSEVSDLRLGPHAPRLLAQPCDVSVDERSYERCEKSRVRAISAVQRAEAVLDERRADLNQSTFIHADTGTDWSAARRDVEDIRFWHDPVGRKGKDPGTFEAFLAYVHAARESVLIESTYLILSKNSKNALRQAIDRGVKVRVLTNSLASTQNLFAQGGYEGKKRKLVRMGIEVWEYKGPRGLHAKSVVIDDQVAIIGNFNIDPRSEFLNTELAVVARDEHTAAQLRSSMDARLSNAWLIGADGRAIGEEKRFPGAKTGKIIKLRLFQFLAPFIKKQL